MAAARRLTSCRREFRTRVPDIFSSAMLDAVLQYDAAAMGHPHQGQTAMPLAPAPAPARTTLPMPPHIHTKHKHRHQQHQHPHTNSSNGTSKTADAAAAGKAPNWWAPTVSIPAITSTSTSATTTTSGKKKKKKNKNVHPSNTKHMHVTRFALCKGVIIAIVRRLDAWRKQGELTKRCTHAYLPNHYTDPPSAAVAAITKTKLLHHHHQINTLLLPRQQQQQQQHDYMGATIAMNAAPRKEGAGNSSIGDNNNNNNTQTTTTATLPWPSMPIRSTTATTATATVPPLSTPTAKAKTSTSAAAADEAQPRHVILLFRRLLYRLTDQLVTEAQATRLFHDACALARTAATLDAPLKRKFVREPLVLGNTVETCNNLCISPELRQAILRASEQRQRSWMATTTVAAASKASAATGVELASKKLAKVNTATVVILSDDASLDQHGSSTKKTKTKDWIEALQLSIPLQQAVKQSEKRMKCPTCTKRVSLYCAHCMRVVMSEETMQALVQKHQQIGGGGSNKQLQSRSSASSSSWPAASGLPVRLEIVRQAQESVTKATAVHACVLFPEQCRMHVAGPDTVPAFDKESTVILYPAADAVLLSELSDAEVAKIERVVVVESTWQKTGGVLALPQLQGLRRIRIAANRSTSYWRTQALGQAYLATIEAMYYVCVEMYGRLHRKRGSSDGGTGEPAYQGQFDDMLLFYAVQHERVRSRIAAAGAAVGSRAGAQGTAVGATNTAKTMNAAATAGGQGRLWAPVLVPPAMNVHHR